MGKRCFHRALKICIISPSRWRYTKRLAEELCRLDNEVILLVDKRNDADIFKIISERCQVKEVWRQNSLFPWYLFRLPHELLKVKPAILHFQYEYLIFGRPIIGVFFPFLLLFLKMLEKIAGFKIALTMHSVIPLDKVKMLERMILLPFTKTLVYLSDKVIVHTPIAKYILISDYEVDEKKITVIPHGVETKLQCSKSEREKIGEKYGGKIILHFGIIRPVKGLDTLLMAFKSILNEHKDATLLIIGWFHEYLTETKNVEFLSSIKNDGLLKEHVKLLIGYLPEEKLYFFVDKCNVICFPYRENYVVGVSGAVADVIMCGKPIIVTKCMKFMTFKNFPNIIFVDDNEKSIAEALNLALTTPPKHFAPSIFKEFFWDNVAKKTLSCYWSMLVR